MPARDDNKEKKYVLVMTSDANDDTTALNIKRQPQQQNYSTLLHVPDKTMTTPSKHFNKQKAMIYIDSLKGRIHIYCDKFQIGTHPDSQQFSFS